MVRRHGWQLPAHTLQVVAITVFFLLVIAFYAFFAPFLGGQILEYTAIAIYTPVVLAVFILYVRCTAINPADPGVLQTFDGKHISKSKNNVRLQGSNLSSMHSSPSSGARSSRGSDFQNRTPAEEGRIDIPTDHPTKRSVSCFSTGGIICALFVKEDCCKHGASETQADGEGALFCTLCNVEVSKFSKHCRCCDKCVDGFDHHCRWLNNCVGRRNYMTFISLMVTSLSWLLIECGVGIAVFVRCFTDRKGMEHHIIDKLGNGFSRAPFATIAAICSAVSLLACVPLWQLFFFHMLLIRKGLTTYEYIVAMRAMSEPPEGSVADDNQNVLYSPAGSATTGLSGRSSLSQQYKAAWCTPPRVFVDDQDEVVPHLDTGMIPSTANPAPSGFTERGNKLPKRPIKRSAWKLAKLDPNEAMKAAAKARASSSVLRPAGSSQFSQTNASSSSRHSNVSAEFGINNEMKNDMKLSPVVHSCSPSHASSEGYERSMSSSSAPSPSHVPVVLDSPVEHPKGPSNTMGTVSLLRSLPPDQSLNSRQSFPSTNLNPILQPTSASDNKTMQKKMAGASAAASSGQLPALARENKRISVVWDQEAGRYVSVPPTARAGTALEIPVQPLLQTAASNPPMETSSQSRRAALPEPSTVNAPLQQREKLMCREQSIFFGGPILDVPARECKK